MTNNTDKYFTQKNIIKFFSDWSKLITLVAVTLLSIYFSNQPVVHQGELQKYLNSFTQWLPLTLLIWMTKLEIDIKSDFEKLEKHISEKYKSLYREISENEKNLIQLWNRFSLFLNDDDIETTLHEFLAHYSEIKILNDEKITCQSKRAIKRAHQILQKREFVIRFGEINDYPGPFYIGKNKEIIATNIGNVSKGFWAGIQKDKNPLIDLNSATILKNRSNSSFKIRRIFILERGDITDDLYNLMNKFRKIGVKVRYLPLSQANRLAEANSTDEINRLEDFTVFIAENDSLPSYSGRLENLQTPGRMIISSHPQVIDGLKKQFEALWVIAQEYNGRIDL
ncbi:hypothetical protein H6G41_28860 [Tolypothrix sp. FACHB-123]|uniref:hypothetical protein n=1 Tax=Tolypothrix sp. FACHB-123 TaxID=2692868 RepID=UPI001684A41A|nr:hypothetical protein [Tolypothrix sp. FACHB-123]MBD2358573.1 hypothetical protein [Tolypothrix sp. FACHB-123]